MKDERNPCTANYCFCFFDKKNKPCSPEEVAAMEDSVMRMNRNLDITQELCRQVREAAKRWKPLC
jgi:hypothetical protein